MENLGQYILSVIAAAMICTIAVSLIPSQQGKAWVRFVGGLILVVTVIKPLASLQIEELNLIESGIWSSGEAFSSDGENQTRESLASIIKQRCETYIVDKANAMGIQITAEITLSADAVPVPVSAAFYGDVSFYQRSQLEAMIQEDIGITKENLQWMD